MSSGLVGVAGRGPVTGLALGLELGLGGGPGGIAFAHPVPLLAAGRSGGGVEAQVGPAGGAPEQLGPGLSVGSQSKTTASSPLRWRPGHRAAHRP